MKNLEQKVINAIKTGNYTYDVQYCHPETVPKNALQLAEDTAEDYFSNIENEEVIKYVKKSINENGDEANVSSILTLIADTNCNHQNYETITCVVYYKK